MVVPEGGSRQYILHQLIDAGNTLHRDLLFQPEHHHLLKEIYWEFPPDLCIKYPFPFLHFACNFIISNDAVMAEEGRPGRLR
jgi:hypothetical protein